MASKNPKYAAYAAAHPLPPGKRRRTHVGRPRRPLSVSSGVCSGIPLPGEMGGKPRFPHGYQPRTPCTCPADVEHSVCPHCENTQRPQKYAEHIERCHNAAVSQRRD
jgi:hypothetical protein